ncbi:MAG: nucleoside phosphorylase, partial [Flavobacteriales bacterium]
MVKTLIVAATEGEINGLRLNLINKAEYGFLVTGIGMVNTTYALTKQLVESELPVRIINVGIA